MTDLHLALLLQISGFWQIALYCLIIEDNAECSLVPFKKNLHNSFEQTTTVNIRGLCRQSFIDKIYMVEYTKYVKLLSSNYYTDIIQFM